MKNNLNIDSVDDITLDDILRIIYDPFLQESYIDKNITFCFNDEEYIIFESDDKKNNYINNHKQNKITQIGNYYIMKI